MKFGRDDLNQEMKEMLEKNNYEVEPLLDCYGSRLERAKGQETLYNLAGMRFVTAIAYDHLDTIQGRIYKKLPPENRIKLLKAAIQLHSLSFPVMRRLLSDPRRLAAHLGLRAEMHLKLAHFQKQVLGLPSVEEFQEAERWYRKTFEKSAAVQPSFLGGLSEAFLRVCIADALIGQGPHKQAEARLEATAARDIFHKVAPGIEKRYIWSAFGLDE
jgi:hypothetical protein